MALCYSIPSETEMLEFGRDWAHSLSPGSVVFLEGNLGVGKTTLVRGILQGLGHQGAVTSPTYTLVETYHLDAYTVYHFDLYRIQTPDELEFIGIRDMLDTQSVALIEWPERGAGTLPAANYRIEIRYPDNGSVGRDVKIVTCT